MKLILFLSFIFSSSVLFAQTDTIESRIVLIGDAGQLVNGRTPVINAIKQKIPLDNKTVVIYLGDNIYPEGLPDDQMYSYGGFKAALDSQAAILVGTKARGYFIPGNHDWENGGATGYDRIRNQQRYIDGIASNIQFLPKEGCPGPVEVSVSENVTMIIVDSHWWLHEHDKPGLESDCSTKSEAEVLAQIEDIIARNARKLIVFASHHPFKSYGIHGGNFHLKQHIFPLTDMNPNLWIPLPLIGSIYPITRSVFGTIQDLPHPWYQNMVKQFSKEVKKAPHAIFVAGHEHNLQLIKDSSFYYIVSGAGCKNTRVNSNKKTIFSEDRKGFAVLTISKNKNVTTDFYTIDINGDPDTAYSATLLNFSKIPEVIANKDTSQPIINFRDSVTVAINADFAKARKAKRFILGDNYRTEWATPVKLPKFNIREEKGGFTITGIGGGKQTKSLRLTDKRGKEWALRTVVKDPEAVVPENFRNTIAEELVQDYISASNPFGPLVVPTLADAVGVIQAKPQMFFVPDDPALGYYRPMFANTVCLLEEREPVPKSEDTKSLPKTFEKLLEDNDHRVDQESVLRARAFDMFIEDWDRHLDQFRFAEGDTGKGKLYYMIPRDRDQAFFWSDGALLNYFSKRTLRFLKGFQPKIVDVNWLNWPARDVDKIFMTQLNENDWRRIISKMQTQLTDDVIEKAVKQLPPPIYPLQHHNMVSKLKGRRDDLLRAGLVYYKFLSKYVNVFGSNKKEFFRVSGAGEHVKVEVFKRTDESDTAKLMYSRIFDKLITEEVRLYGFNDDDVFDIAANTPNGVKIRMIGGKGEDSFNIRSNSKNFIYDFASATNQITQGGKRTRMRISDNPSDNTFKLLENTYNTNKFPVINFAFNAEDKFMIGLGFERITHTFRKEPFATRQRLSTLYAPSSGAYQARYLGELNHVLGNKDIVIKAQLVKPVLNNFFGLGNTTTFTKPRDFYRVRYNFLEADILFRKRFGTIANITLGPTIYNYWNHPEDNENKILQFPSQIGLDSASVYGTKTYAGAKFGINIDNLGNDLFPTRGIQWNTELSSVTGLNTRSKPVTKITSDMAVYGAFTDPAKFVTVMRLGAGHIFTDSFEYFQAMNLGQNNFLRGFRKNRHSGSSLAYGSLEGRIQLFANQDYLLPGPIGIIGFTDVGKVWMKNQTSKKWHHSFGGGLYFAPFNTLLISATVAKGEEELLFNLSLGTRFNLMF
jgi:hypothetical protein